MAGRGRPRKKPVEAVEAKAVETEEVKRGTEVELPIDDIREITVTSRRRVSLADPQYDPFKEHKKDENKFYYRAVNTRPHLLRKREAEGYQTIPGTEYGDLVLAKLPKDVRKEREDYAKEKTIRQTKAAVEQFKAEAEKSGMKPYEEP